MYGNKTKWGMVAGFWLTATLVSAAPPGSAPETTEQGSGHPIPDHGVVDMHGYPPKHWDLWANYCAEKRREHDPVRHYHPLVRLKHSILPHHGVGCGHHGYGECGQCHGSCHHHGGHDCCHGSPAAADPATPPAQDTVKPVPARKLPQPPAPLTDASPQSTRSSPSTQTERPQPSTAPVRRLPPEEPIVIPPTTDQPAPPKNPLPKEKVGGTSRLGSPMPEVRRDLGSYFNTQ